MRIYVGYEFDKVPSILVLEAICIEPSLRTLFISKLSSSQGFETRLPLLSHSPILVPYDSAINGELRRSFGLKRCSRLTSSFSTSAGLVIVLHLTTVSHKAARVARDADSKP